MYFTAHSSRFDSNILSDTFKYAIVVVVYVNVFFNNLHARFKISTRRGKGNSHTETTWKRIALCVAVVAEDLAKFVSEQTDLNKGTFLTQTFDSYILRSFKKEAKLGSY